MDVWLESWLNRTDHVAAGLLFPLAVWILLSGLDDLFLIGVWFYDRIRPGSKKCLRPDHKAPEKHIAIFVPLWQEHRVIRGMVEHNIAALTYHNYDFFIGGYPNDEATLDVIRQLERRFDNVHLALVPHDGPTSKADCLNWIYQSMLLYEQEHGRRFDIVVTHDAEDLIHPQSLKWINSYADEYEMVQIPVLALPTGFREFTHGVYCDEFAEYQMKDVPARQILGSFVPSNGVGTGYTRRALELLAESSSNRIFEPTCLTEDYENGIRLHELGCRQMFVPLKKLDDAFVATREYFPRDRRAATRQRTRWITGISLQGWERHGWRGSAVDVYWLWRDRKSLVGTPVTILANLLFAYGVLTAVWSYATGRPWGLGSVAGKWEAVFAVTFSLQILSILFRSYCVTKVYGLLFALGVGLRVPWANWINCVATVRALRDFSRTKIHGEPLRWLKTEHAYPSLDALIEHKRRLGEVLVQSGYLSQASLDRALVTKPSDTRLGEHLVELRLLTEVELYEALSLQQSVDLEFPEPLRIRRAIACSLPRHVIEEWKVLPFKIESGALFLAGPEVPTEEMLDALRRFTRLELRFHLTPPGLFERLTAELL